MALAVFAAVFVLSGGLAAYYTQVVRIQGFYLQNWLVLNLAGSLLASTPLVLRAFDLLGRQSGPVSYYRELHLPVGSLRELDQLVRSQRRLDSPLTLLRQTHPHLRYLAAMRGKLDPRDQAEWIEALMAERSAVIRRAIAKNVAENLGEATKELEIQFAELVKLVPESAYIVEAYGELSARVEALPFNLLILAYLANRGPRGAIEATVTRSHLTMAGDLYKSFEMGLDHAPPGLAELGDNELREITRRFSPFEDGCLGSFDELQHIAFIDQLYIFFRQLQFYLDRDLIGSASTPPSTTDSLP